MGWLLTIVLAMPMTADDVTFRMWFSRETYCNLAVEKFGEKAFTQQLPDGREAEGRIKSATCRELGEDEQALVPEHLLWKVR